MSGWDIELPEYLAVPLNLVGLPWPNVSYTDLNNASKLFDNRGPKMDFLVGEIEAAGQRVTAMAAGGDDAAVAAFTEWFESDVGPAKRVRWHRDLYYIMCEVCGIVAIGVLCLKMIFVFELGLLLYEITAAIAAAIWSGGFSAQLIPGFIAKTRAFLSQAIDRLGTAFGAIKDNLLAILGSMALQAVLPAAAKGLGHLAGGADIDNVAKDFGWDSLKGFGRAAAWTVRDEYGKTAPPEPDPESDDSPVQAEKSSDPIDAKYDAEMAAARAAMDAVDINSPEWSAAFDRLSAASKAKFDYDWNKPSDDD
jgi:hypothetical protein